MELQHKKPAWQQKADFVIGARIDDNEWKKSFIDEQLCARQISGTEFELCCIPFALYGMTLGDIVEVDQDYNIIKVVQESDHVGFRVATEDSQQQIDLLEAIDAFKANLAMELFSDKLVALDVDNAVTAKNLADLLQELETKDKVLQYETIRK